MGRARQDIVNDNSLLHVTFRCHNQEFYFHSDKMKALVYKILLKYNRRFNIHILEWCLMSNHGHFLLYTPERDILSRFMHSTNLAIAKAINKEFNKRGQAIEDRYKSPVIESEAYALNTISYIWLNPLRAGMVNHKSIKDYRYSSLYYKLRGINDPLTSDYKIAEDVFGVDLTDGKSEQKFAIEWLGQILTRGIDFEAAKVFEHLHSVGSDAFIKRRLPRKYCSSA